MPFTTPPTAVTGGTVDASYTNIFANNDAWFNQLLPQPTAANQVPISSGTANASWGFIATAQIADGALSTTVFSAGAFTASKFVPGVISIDKLSSEVQDRLTFTNLGGWFRTVAEIPTGWTRDTAMSGRFLIVAGATFGETWVENTDYGSSWGHQHNFDLTSSAPSAILTNVDGRESDTGASLSTHTHDLVGATSSTSWMPPSRAVVFANKS